MSPRQLTGPSKHRAHDYLERGTFKTTGKAINTPEGYIMGWGITVPADAGTGWAPSAEFIHTDGSGVTDMKYINIGSVTSCNFNAITVDIGTDPTP